MPITNDDGKVVGYRVEPEFGLDWPHIRTLQHFAALIELRTGMKMRVIQRPSEDDELEQFEVMSGHATGGPAPYEVTFAWLSGFETGIHEILWSAQKKEAISE